jgi:hypothetical protein
MNCPKCKSELTACGGVPTVWKCVPCSTAALLASPPRKEVYFEGDTQKTLKEVSR